MGSREDDRGSKRRFDDYIPDADRAREAELRDKLQREAARRRAVSFASRGTKSDFRAATSEDGVREDGQIQQGRDGG